MAVVNAGDQPAVDLRLTMRFSVGLVPPSYRNCRYGTDQVLATVVVCTVRGTFAPGQRHKLRAGSPPRSARRRSGTSESRRSWSH
ncbi:hypothetical protein NKG94_33670 [Micromonospora sp. M12]